MVILNVATTRAQVGRTVENLSAGREPCRSEPQHSRHAKRIAIEGVGERHRRLLPAQLPETL